MSEPKKMSWSDIEDGIKIVLPEKTKLIERLKSAYEKRTKDDSENKDYFDINEKAENCFVYAVFKDCVCLGKYKNRKLELMDKNCDVDKLLELRVFNKYFEARVIYSFEKDAFFYRYLDDYNESNNLYIYKEQHYIDGEWQGEEFKSKIRSLPELPFLKDENNKTIDKFKDKDLKLLIKTYIKFDSDGSPEVADWRLAGFLAGGNEVECDG